MTMTSQKRYRHHQENNSAARFRDLPPRFKRQKSSSSPKPASSDIDLVNQENERCPSPVSPSVSPALSQNSTTYCNSCTPPSSDAAMKHPFRTVNSQQARYNSVLWQGQVPKDPLLSVNTGLVDYSPFPMRDPYISGGEYLLAQTHASPPLSRWAVIDSARQCNSAEALLRSELSAYPHNLRASPGLVGCSEMVAPALEMARSSGGDVWPLATDGPHQDRMSPGCLSDPQTGHQSPVVSEEVAGKPPVDYSDPDIRTIEMLRELERVADQKEKEDDESDAGVDRKNLVSHHLRMLMCAVDRYTADLGEEASGGDESRTGATPPPRDAVQPSVSPATVPSTPAVEMPGDWHVAQSRKRGQPQHSQDQRQERRALGSQQVRDSPNWQSGERVKLQAQHLNHERRAWASAPPQQPARQLYTGAWQANQPPQSQSPTPVPVMPVKVVSPPPPPPQQQQQLHHGGLSPASRTSSPHVPPSPRPILSANAAPAERVNLPRGKPGCVSPLQGGQSPSTVPPVRAITSRNQDLIMPEDDLAHIWGASGRQATGWDIWSSPSFVNIYSQDSCDKGPSNWSNFGNAFLGRENTDPKTRKPLYNR